MYAKISGNTVTKFPYTFGDLRKDNPNVSFPKNITSGIMNKYGMVGVLEGPKPTLTANQRSQRNALPTKQDGGYWMIEYTAVDLTAEEITARDNATAANNRSRRDELLKDTDHYGLSDVAMSQEMIDYRAALRNLPEHDNWPNLSDSDWPTKP